MHVWRCEQGNFPLSISRHHFIRTVPPTLWLESAALNGANFNMAEQLEITKNKAEYILNCGTLHTLNHPGGGRCLVKRIPYLLYVYQGRHWCLHPPMASRGRFQQQWLQFGKKTHSRPGHWGLCSFALEHLPIQRCVYISGPAIKGFSLKLLPSEPALRLSCCSFLI